MATKGFDCTFNLTSDLAKQFLSEGYEFVVRYLVPEDIKSWKRLGKQEAQDVSDAGLWIVSVYESSADRAAGGWPNGIEDAKLALQAAEELGQPYGSVIYFAVDWDAQPEDMEAIKDYLVAAGSILVGKYNVGVYGSYTVIESMFSLGACHWFWQTYAWSAGKVSSHNNLFQYKNGVNQHGVDTDLNESYGNEGWWNLKTPVVVAPQPPDLKPTYRVFVSGQQVASFAYVENAEALAEQTYKNNPTNPDVVVKYSVDDSIVHTPAKHDFLIYQQDKLVQSFVDDKDSAYKAGWDLFNKTTDATTYIKDPDGIYTFAKHSEDNPNAPKPEKPVTQPTAQPNDSNNPPSNQDNADVSEVIAATEQASSLLARIVLLLKKIFFK